MSVNFLEDISSALVFADALREGKIEDPNVIKSYTIALLDKETIPLSELMRNVVVVKKNSPNLPTVSLACYESMMMIANKSQTKGSYGLRVAELLFESQFDNETNKYKEDSRSDVILEMISNLDPLTNEDRTQAKPLFDKINKTLSDNYRYAEFVDPDDLE